MKKVLFINTCSGFSSTGNLVAELSRIEGFETLVCYGRKHDYAGVNSYRFANIIDNIFGALGTILFDNNLNICSIATKRLIKKIKEFKPDVINIHNMHGYYLNIEMLFKFLKEYNKPVILTMHDAFILTGYCPHFDGINCDKYKTECKNCEYGFSYPFSLFKQNVTKDYYKKKELFNSLDKLIVMPTSKWLEKAVRQSILKDADIRLIYDGVDLNSFYASKEKNERFTVLAVASIWNKMKGIDDLNKVIPLLDKDIDVIVVGGNSESIKATKCIARTSNKQELVDLYSSSHVLVNPTLQETFGLVNVESNACGTPVITYNTGGSPETINSDSGIVVDKYDYKKLAETINAVKRNYTFDKEKIIANSKQFDKKYMLENYKNLFNSLS